MHLLLEFVLSEARKKMTGASGPELRAVEFSSPPPIDKLIAALQEHPEVTSASGVGSISSP